MIIYLITKLYEALYLTLTTLSSYYSIFEDSAVHLVDNIITLERFHSYTAVGIPLTNKKEVFLNMPP